MVKWDKKQTNKQKTQIKKQKKQPTPTTQVEMLLIKMGYLL